MAASRPLYGFAPFGEQKPFWNDFNREVLLSSGWGGGKTRTILEKLHYHALRYPGTSCLIIRKVNADLPGSTLKEFFTKVLPPEHVAAKNKDEQWVVLPNGSDVWWSGMDRVTKIGSTEYGFIAVDEANELSLEDWHWLDGRLRRKGPGFRQIVAATNPDDPGHWLYERFMKEKYPNRSVYYLKPLDNPNLPDDYYPFLKSLTGLVKRRYALGEWVHAEGGVLTYDALHWIHASQVPERRFTWRVGMDLAVVDDPVKAAKEDTNYFAAFVTAYDSLDKVAYAIDCARTRGLRLDEAVTWLHNIVSNLPPCTVMAEANQAQRWFVQEASKLGIRIHPVQTTTRKEGKLAMLSVPTSTRRVVFVNHDDPSTYEPGRTHDPRWDPFVDEWTGFPAGHNDLLDGMHLSIDGLPLGLDIASIKTGRAYKDK